jgi:hypothetical protein
MSADATEETVDQIAEQGAEEESSHSSTISVASETEDTAAETATTESEASEAESTEESTSEVESAGESAAGETETETPEWITEDVRSLAGSLGIEDSVLESFESGRDFLRACRMLDQARAPATATAEDESKAGETDEAEEATKTGTEDRADPFAFDLSKYDELTQQALTPFVAAAKYLRDENVAVREQLTQLQGLGDRLAQIEREAQERIIREEQAQFDGILDGMDDELFGKRKSLTDETEQRREQVWDAFRRLAQTYPDPSQLPDREVLVQRAAMMICGDEMLKRAEHGIYKKIRDQSRGRRPSPGGRKRSTATRDDGPPTQEERKREILAMIEEHPELSQVP